MQCAATLNLVTVLRSSNTSQSTLKAGLDPIWRYKETELGELVGDLKGSVDEEKLMTICVKVRERGFHN